MSETTDIAILEIKPEQAPALYVPNGLDTYLDHIREMAKETPDVTTAKGRERIGSLARQVGSSKTAIEKPGRDYLRRLKEAVKPAEEELRRFTRECDAIRDAILAPRIEWEAEQERLKAEEEARIAAEKLAAKIESDHELALLLNEKFDSDAAQKAEEAERQRIAHEEELKRQVVEQARNEAEAAAQQERQQHQDALSEINGIQQQVIIAQTGRAGVREGGTIECIRETLAETEAWPIDKRFGSLQGTAEKVKQQSVEQIKQMLVAAEIIQRQQDELAKAEREKQAAIAEAQRKAQEEADRIKREAEQKEAARLAEEKRIADEAEKKAANKAHQAEVNNAAMAVLTKTGISDECAKQAIIAIAQHQISSAKSGDRPIIQLNY
ncbi:hypothetical protein EH228_04635 [Erwinia endophytica]|uniref:hypothetical protein n=1 Tax=Erwinia endophytica TaxID=1563158 RepID=UPI001265F683|nr:hypothetical protein [Erwinia endophytica]KAB8312967.1 hypothetical protein EH228_04635 [Erwinia endophytica]